MNKVLLPALLLCTSAVFGQQADPDPILLPSDFGTLVALDGRHEPIPPPLCNAPEPATYGAMAIGLITVGVWRRRKGASK